MAEWMSPAMGFHAAMRQRNAPSDKGGMRVRQRQGCLSWRRRRVQTARGWGTMSGHGVTTALGKTLSFPLILQQLFWVIKC